MAPYSNYLPGSAQIGTSLPLCGDLQIMSAGGFHKQGSQRVIATSYSAFAGKLSTAPVFQAPNPVFYTVCVFPLSCELPLEQVRVKFDARCTGKACDDLSERGESQDSDASEWCEVLLAQHVPQGAYIDVDEVKVRKNKSTGCWSCRPCVCKFSRCICSSKQNTWPGA